GRHVRRRRRVDGGRRLLMRPRSRDRRWTQPPDDGRNDNQQRQRRHETPHQSHKQTRVQADLHWQRAVHSNCRACVSERESKELRTKTSKAVSIVWRSVSSKRPFSPAAFSSIFLPPIVSVPPTLPSKTTSVPFTFTPTLSPRRSSVAFGAPSVDSTCRKRSS